MKTLHFVVLLASVVCMQGATRITNYEWATLEAEGAKLPGRIVEMDGQTVLEVRNTSPRQLQVQLLKIDKPTISQRNYALRAEIKHLEVQGDGFLDMWSVFPSSTPGGIEERYFSRTLSDSGPMGKITGSSDWRPVLLPFHRNPDTPDPVALEVNLILPAQGTVYLKGFELAEFTGYPTASLGTTGAWWNERTGGLIGGLLGASLGCMAGLISWLALKGKARKFVFASAGVLIAVGCLLSIAGIVAFVAHQPRGVWFPLALCGVLMLTIIPVRLRDFRRQYEAEEMRRMQAADALG